jgi:hypothetical protein
MRIVSRHLATACFAGILSLSAAADAATVFNVNREVGTGSVIGTITTDGTMGILSTANITGWNLTLSEGGDTIVLGGANSGRLVDGTGFTANATQLLFDFGSVSRVMFQTPRPSFVGTPFWCLQGASLACSLPLSNETVQASGPGTSFQASFYSTQQVIGTVDAVAQVPLPGALPLLLAGVFGIGLAFRRR